MAKMCVNQSGPKKGKLKKGYKFGKGGQCVRATGHKSASKRASSGKPLSWCVHQSGPKRGKLLPGHKFRKGGGCVNLVETADVSHLPLDGRRGRRRRRRMSMPHLMGLGRMRRHARRHRRY